MILLRIVRRSRWGSPDWLSDGQAPGYSIADFLPEDSTATISLFKVGAARELEEQVVAALASKRESVNSVFDYVLFPEDYLDQVGVSSEQTKGETPDDRVNEELHFDACHVELNSIANLVTLVYAGCRDEGNSVELHRFTPSTIKALIGRFLDPGDLAEARVTPGVLKMFRT